MSQLAFWPLPDDPRKPTPPPPPPRPKHTATARRPILTELDRLTAALRDGTDAWCAQVRAVDANRSGGDPASAKRAAAASRRARRALALACVQCLILAGLLTVGAALLPTTVWG